MCSCDTCCLNMISREIAAKKVPPHTQTNDQDTSNTKALCTRKSQSQQCIAGERSFHMRFKRRKFFFSLLHWLLCFFIMTINEWTHVAGLQTYALVSHIITVIVTPLFYFYLTYVLLALFFFLVLIVSISFCAVFECECAAWANWHHRIIYKLAFQSVQCASRIYFDRTIFGSNKMSLLRSSS